MSVPDAREPLSAAAAVSPFARQLAPQMDYLINCQVTPVQAITLVCLRKSLRTLILARGLARHEGAMCWQENDGTCFEK